MHFFLNLGAMLNAWKRLVPQLQMEAESPAVEARSLNRGTPRGVPETEFLRENLHGTFIFLGSKITTNDDCSHEIKRLLLLGRKDMTNLDCVLKSRDITLLTKVRLVKATV